MDSEKLVVLKNAMSEVESYSAEIKEKREAFELSIKGLIDAKNERQDCVSWVKKDLTAEALAEFGGSGLKKLDGGIGIRVKAGIKYDPKKALEYAKEKDMFLALDAKSFEKVASGLNLDWVQETATASVTFPKEIKL